MPWGERNDIDRIVSGADVDLREGSEAPRADAGGEAAEQTPYLLLQTVELAEQVGSAIEITHGHILLGCSMEANGPTRSSSPARLLANKSKHAARLTGATA